MLAKPKSQGVLLVSDVVATLTIFAATCPDVGSVGEVLARRIFLYPLVAAGRSVESIRATVLAKLPAPWSNGRSRCTFRRRNFARSIRSRNSWSILTSGMANRLRSRANDLSGRCSPSKLTIKLYERAGVSRGSRLTRNN